MSSFSLPRRVSAPPSLSTLALPPQASAATALSLLALFASGPAAALQPAPLFSSEATLENVPQRLEAGQGSEVDPHAALSAVRRGGRALQSCVSRCTQDVRREERREPASNYRGSSLIECAQMCVSQQAPAVSVGP